MNKLALMGLVGVAGVSALVAAPAEAAPLNLGGTDYEVITATGTFTELADLLMAQPWWGSLALAEEASSELGGALGYPNDLFDSSYQPLFAIGPVGPGVSVRARNANDSELIFAADGVPLTWAVVDESVASVPEPASLMGLLAVGAVAAGGALKRKQAAKA